MMTRRPWVKICGITRLEDARAAVEAGVDAIGFVLAAESSRLVAVDAAARIAAAVPPRVAKVGVFVSQPPDFVREVAARIGLTAVQAHGDESPEDCAAYGVPVVKAIPVGERFDPATLEPYRAFPVLLDAASGRARGGTGRLVDWPSARRARERGYRVLLAGGLSPENLLAAVTAVEPLGVDLNSGVERAPGVKDPHRIARALEALAHLPPAEESTWPW